MGITWEEPPLDGRANGVRNWSVIVEDLRKHPGRWALVIPKTTITGATSMAGYIKKRYGLDAISRGTKVYARYPEKVRKQVAAQLRKPRGKK